MKKRQYPLFCSLLLLLFQGCSRAGAGNMVLQDPALQVIYATAHCSSGEKVMTVSWISAQEALRAAMGRGLIIGAEQAVPSIDFKTEGVLHVGMGVKPSAGYGFDKEAVFAHIENGTAIVHLVLSAPPPGALVAQVLTNPCLLIRMSRGNYSRIQVVDQQGRLLGGIQKLPDLSE